MTGQSSSGHVMRWSRFEGNKLEIGYGSKIPRIMQAELCSQAMRSQEPAHVLRISSARFELLVPL